MQPHWNGSCGASLMAGGAALAVMPGGIGLPSPATSVSPRSTPITFCIRSSRSSAPLRYYCAPTAELGPDVLQAFDDITDQPERVSAMTCERCGNPGVLHGCGGQVKTLCAGCAEVLRSTPV
jgi:hypothetical protein